jgi:hypothetical protein
MDKREWPEKNLKKSNAVSWGGGGGGFIRHGMNAFNG